ncbi:MAG: CoA-binding protein, partial [Nitrososphaeria archaeon]|nr:CoA-binding protein [Nitrososphaeria archaeon]NIQ34041.1 CoA-binding protein [Nitrososphaeria archaeon]
DPGKDSHIVASYLKEAGYRIVPVNPSADEILGEKVYRDLLDIPFEVDVVDVFRPSDEVEPIVDSAIKKNVKALWMQLGIVNEEAAKKKAVEAGLDVVMDRCMMTEHKRLVWSWI